MFPEQAQILNNLASAGHLAFVLTEESNPRVATLANELESLIDSIEADLLKAWGISERQHDIILGKEVKD